MSPVLAFLLGVALGHEADAKKTAERKGTAIRPLEPIRGLAFSPDSGSIAVLDGVFGKRVRVFDTKSGKETLGVSEQITSAYAVDFSADGRIIVTGNGWDENGGLFGASLWDAKTGKPLGDFKGGVQATKCVALSADGRFVAAGDSKGFGRVWEIKTGKCLWFAEMCAGPVEFLVFSGDSKLLATAAHNKIVVYDVPSGKEVHSERLYEWGVVGMRFWPGKHTIISGDASGTVVVLDLEKKQEKRIDLPGIWVDSMRFSQDCKYVAVRMGSIRLWDLETVQEIQRFGVGRKKALLSITSAELSADGTLIAIGAWDTLSVDLSRYEVQLIPTKKK